MFSAHAFKCTLAAILATAALNLPAAALAQTACPDPGVTYLGGNCINSEVRNYNVAPSTTVSGTYTNQLTGQVTATGNNARALNVDAFDNSGTVNATGYSDLYSGHGIYVSNGAFDNSGTVYASGTGTNDGTGLGIRGLGDFTNSGTVYAVGTGTNDGTGIGIRGLGDFTNSGTVYAYGNGSGDGSGYIYGYGYGIDFNGSFTNSGIVYAVGTGSDYGDGYGISVNDSGFTNSGTVYASGTGTGYGSGTGIWVGRGDFTNSGTVYATGSGYGDGIYIRRGDFINSGELTLASNGGTALYFDNDLTAQTFMAQSGSNLIIAGPGPAMYFDTTGILSINSGAGLTILGVNSMGDGSQTFVVAQNVSDTGSSSFETADSAVFSYSQQWVALGGSGGNYEVTVSRDDWASNITGGEGGEFVTGLEDYFKDNEAGGASGESWLDLLDDINSGATKGDVKRRGQDAARLNTAQATGQSLRLIQDASRRAGSIFIEELSEHMRAGMAPAAGGGDSSASVWFSPFYLTANQDSSDPSISSVDGDWWGFTLGAAYAPQDNLNFGLGFHFLKGDLDSGRSYEADSSAWGLDLGFAANLGSGRYRPLLTGTVSHSRHDYDQTRRADGYAYKSSPNINVTYAALGLSQDFRPAGEAFIIRPKIGFDWTRTDMDGYTERGPGLRALSVDSEKFNSYRSELGTALAYKPSESLELEVRAAWLHDFGDRSPILTSVARDVTGLKLYTPRSDNKRDSAALGASASFEAGQGFSFDLDYDGQFNSDLDSHMIWGSLKYTF